MTAAAAQDFSREINWLLRTGSSEDYRTHAQISQRLGAVEAACRYALVGRAQAHSAYTVEGHHDRENLRVAVEAARELLALVAPSLLVDVADVVRREPGDGDGDAPADQELAVGVRSAAAEVDEGEVRDVRAGLRPEVAQRMRVADGELLTPVVQERHDKNSSAVGAPGAENTESLAATVEAPADSPSSSAGRGAGGTRPRWHFPRRRGRSAP